jgi:hypothetical protein
MTSIEILIFYYWHKVSLCVSQFLPKVLVEADLLSQFEEEALLAFDAIYLVISSANDVNMYNNFINKLFPIRCFWD